MNLSKMLTSLSEPILLLGLAARRYEREQASRELDALEARMRHAGGRGLIGALRRFLRR